MKKEDEIKIKAMIVNEVSDNIVDDVLEFSRGFVDNFGMTIDQFERLDYYEQKKLIEKVALLNHKRRKIKDSHIKFKFSELFTHYPIFTKTLKKRK